MHGFGIIVLGICLIMEVRSVDEVQCSPYHWQEQYLSKVIRMEIQQENMDIQLKNVESKLAAQQQVKKPCDDEWISFHTSCYLFGTSFVSFDEAETICKALDAHLVSIQDASENDFIKRRVIEWSAKYFWIGLTDVMNEGDWRWTGTNENVQFFGWNNGEPSGGTRENCVIVSSDQNANWLDVACTNRHYRYICEK